MIPKGTLLIIGGAEHKGDNNLDMETKNLEFKQFEILKLLLKEKKKVEVITTGSEIKQEVKKEYKQTFDKIGFNDTGFLPIEDKNEARLSKYINRIEKANTIFFSGGDQFRLATILGGTPVTDIILKRYFEEEDFVIAGTSAGAMVMSKIMISGGGTNEALLKNDINTSSGFGLLEHCIIDTHFIKRGRFGRLAHAVIINPEQLGVGLGEDTALIVKNGKDAECLGSGMVVIIDGSGIEQTNIAEVEAEYGVFVENLKVHLLVKGCRFDLKTRTLANPAISQRKKNDG
ncbi:cyanophycinase [Salegentibacter sp. JZCK2]|uniref:cyanophycinase n=1 Tax=Salegentibacter tibetensis TaxID=2873600 RepID=UPI001CCE6D64|nr:cyanophycinase [Salegentibacter tibetensis]MBZ9728063.1 cyanophycinase [Salegentibacter tibetensis]